MIVVVRSTFRLEVAGSIVSAASGQFIRVGLLFVGRAHFGQRIARLRGDRR